MELVFEVFRVRAERIESIRLFKSEFAADEYAGRLNQYHDPKWSERYQVRDREVHCQIAEDYSVIRSIQGMHNGNE